MLTNLCSEVDCISAFEIYDVDVLLVEHVGHDHVEYVTSMRRILGILHVGDTIGGAISSGVHGIWGMFQVGYVSCRVCIM